MAVHRKRWLGLSGLAAAGLAAAMIGPWAMSATAASQPWQQFNFVRLAWQNGQQVALFIQLTAPPNGPDPCMSTPPSDQSTYLIAPINPKEPQGTAITIDDFQFGEPHHDDVVPDSVGTTPTPACGYILSPTASAGSRVLSRPGHPTYGPRQWAYAAQIQPGGPYVPLFTQTAIAAARDAGLVQTTPIGGGGNLWVAPCTITGGPGKDTLIGTPGNDVICSSGGNDTLAGGGGDDILVGSSANDNLLGGPGNDVLIGGYGNDDLNGEAGQDKLYGGWGYVPGADPATGFPAPDPTMPSDGNDKLTGNGDGDYLFGGYGNDRLTGSGPDRLVGGYGNDNCPGDC